MQLPFDAEDPAGLVTRFTQLHQAFGTDLPLPGPPVLWLAPRLPRPTGSAPAEGPAQAQAVQSLPHDPLWWAGGAWRGLGPLGETPHARARGAYTPRRFQPPWRRGAILEPVPAPGEAGPPAGGRAGGSSVVRLLKALFCQHEGALWARPVIGGDWLACPWDTAGLDLSSMEALETRCGHRYVLFVRRRGESPSGARQHVLLYDTVRNTWPPILGPVARRSPAVAAGRAAAEALPALALAGAAPSPPPLRAWLLEATPNYAVLLAPVRSDGAQRGPEEDVHTAVLFLGHAGETISHLLACSAADLVAQRYDGYFLFSREPAPGRAAELEEAGPEASAWLLAAEDASVPPLPVLLPTAAEGWSRDSGWSLAMVRGNLEEMAPSLTLRHDMSPRLYLLEEAPGALRLWCSRRVDDALDTLCERHSLDGRQLLRHSLSFAPLPQGEVPLPAGGPARGASWALWSPEVRHAAKVCGCGGPSGGRLSFWRCGAAYEGTTLELQASRPCARPTAAQVAGRAHLEELPLGRRGWDPWQLPAEDAHSAAVVTGLPCFPKLQRSDGTFHRPKDWWVHPLGGDAAQHAPLSALR